MLGNIRLKGNSRVKRLMAVFTCVITMLIGSSFLASPAMANTGNQHVCEDVGTPDIYGNQAVICTDLITVYYNDGTYQSEAQTEAICENSGTIEPCESVAIANETAYTNSTGTHVSPVWTDGCAAGLCGDRSTFAGYAQPQDSSATCIANTWGVTLASGTDIKLPGSNTPERITANFGTPHTSIGNC
jgi:hypothetical protein